MLEVGRRYFHIPLQENTLYHHGDSTTSSSARSSSSGIMDLLFIPDLRASQVPQRAGRYVGKHGQRSQLRSYVAVLFASPSQILTDVLLATGEPEGVLHRQDEGYGLGAEGTARINATLLSLVRNEEIDGMVQAMQDLERTWNHKFNYPWTFFNDVPFTEEFKRRTQAETKAECLYGRVKYSLHCCPSNHYYQN